MLPAYMWGRDMRVNQQEVYLKREQVRINRMVYLLPLMFRKRARQKCLDAQYMVCNLLRIY